MVGIFSWYGIPQSFEERINDIKSTGFDAVSMWIDEEGRWEIDPHEIPRIIHGYGLHLEYAHAPYREINQIWYENVSKSIEEKLYGYIDYCKKHTIPILVMHLTHGSRIKDITNNGIALLNRIVRYAHDSGVLIAVENTKSNRVIERVLEEIEDTALGLCFDTSHDNLYGQSKFELLEKYGNRLLCLHISDNDGVSDDHWIPYQGKVDWNAFIEKFPKGYTGILNLEVVRKDRSIGSKEFLKTAYEVIRDFEDRIHTNRTVTN